MPDLYWLFSRLDLLQVTDILIVALIFYLGFLSIQGTRAVQLLWGIGLLIFVGVSISTFFQLTTLSWLIRNSIPALLVGIPVIFQPELRRILERVGRAGGIVNRPLGLYNTETEQHTLDEVARACAHLAERRFGALIVLERNTGLQDYVDTGITLDGALSAETLETIFFPNTPLHDGAVIVRGERIAAAGCILPLTEGIPEYPQLGTRHRAAVGITEQSDCVALIVSEQTGTISISQNGRLFRSFDEIRLKNALMTIYHARQKTSKHFWNRTGAVSASHNRVVPPKAPERAAEPAHEHQSTPGA